MFPRWHPDNIHELSPGFEAEGGVRVSCSTGTDFDCFCHTDLAPLFSLPLPVMTFLPEYSWFKCL